MLIPCQPHALAKNIFNICIASLLQTYMQLIDNWRVEVFVYWCNRTPFNYELLGMSLTIFLVMYRISSRVVFTCAQFRRLSKVIPFFWWGGGGGKTLLLSYHYCNVIYYINWWSTGMFSHRERKREVWRCPSGGEGGTRCGWGQGATHPPPPPGPISRPSSSSVKTSRLMSPIKVLEKKQTASSLLECYFVIVFCLWFFVFTERVSRCSRMQSRAQVL